MGIARNSDLEVGFKHGQVKETGMQTTVFIYEAPLLISTFTNNTA